jgi:Flp pilus assembly protein CpaB
VKKKSPPYAIIIAALLGLAAVFAFYKMKQNQDAAAAAALAKVQADDAAKLLAAQNQQPVAPAPPPTNMRNVYYATQPVEAGAKISEAFYEKKATPNDILPEAYSEGSDIIGFYAIRNIEKGDPLTPHNIGKSLPFMSQRISPGMRAISLTVFNAQDNNTGGFAIDGDKVDLLFTHFTPDNTVEENTELVMQNLEILYVPGPKIESEQVNGIAPAPPPGDPISITFQVTPEQAQALTYMSQIKNGQFGMILRARSDKTVIKIKPFVGSDYSENDYRNVQAKIVDKSMIRVQALAAQIAAEDAALQKTQGPQGTTNETNPTPPAPTP